MNRTNPLRNESAFKQTQQHRGLTNKAGENNCFLNVTIQALWHLGPFRVHLQQLIASLKGHNVTGLSQTEKKKTFLFALCNLFIQYEFTDQDVLPPNELRESLSALSADFELGKIADATETLETILQAIHDEFNALCPNHVKCLAHATFGGIILEQSRCNLCGASSEPTIRANYLLYFQAAEMLNHMTGMQPPISLLKKVDQEKNNHSRKWMSFFNISSFLTSDHNHHQSKQSKELLKNSRKEFEKFLQKQLFASKQFGDVLRKCLLSLGTRSCPSLLEDVKNLPLSKSLDSMQAKSQNNVGNLFAADLKLEENKADSKYTKSIPQCQGKASTFFHSLDAPLVLTLSIGWSDSKENSENLLRFYSMISSLIQLEDLFSEDLSISKRRSVFSSKVQKPPTREYSPAYVFRGMVCYYGKHYVSIFMDSVTTGEESYLLFDDHRIRPIGSWNEAVQYCVSSCYQPVLLLYELEKNSIVFTLDKIEQDYSGFSLADSHTEGLTSREADPSLTSAFAVSVSPDVKTPYCDVNDQSKRQCSSTEISDQNFDENEEENDSLQIISMDTVDDVDSRAILLPADAKSDLDLREPMHISEKEYAILDDSSLAHSINSNYNLVHVGASNSSLALMGQRLIQAKSEPDELDIYTSEGRSKGFWSRYYEARYGLQSSQLNSLPNPYPKDEGNMKNYFHSEKPVEITNFPSTRDEESRSSMNAQRRAQDKSGHSSSNLSYADYFPENNPIADSQGGSVPNFPCGSREFLPQRLLPSNLSPVSPRFLKYKIQSVIEIWGRRPYRYHISLPVLYNERTTSSYPQVMLGIILDTNEKDEVFVTGFYKHPVTQKELPAELSKKIHLMDQLLALNGEHINSLPISRGSAREETGSKKLSALHKLIDKLREPFILLDFQSAYYSVLWYCCPNCSCTNEIFPDREELLKKQLLRRIQKRKVKEHDNSNIHSIQNYGIYFRCKFCQVKSLCRDYLPDLSEH
eukprot:gene590-630_t